MIPRKARVPSFIAILLAVSMFSPVNGQQVPTPPPTPIPPPTPTPGPTPDPTPSCSGPFCPGGASNREQDLVGSVKVPKQHASPREVLKLTKQSAHGVKGKRNSKAAKAAKGAAHR
jgi:hypothetical protein